MRDDNEERAACLNTDDPPTFYGDIVPLFGTMDVECMKNRGLLLLNYERMSNPATAHSVLQHLKGADNGGWDPRMPLDPGDYWADEDIAVFEQWIACGCKIGTRPAEDAVP